MFDKIKKYQTDPRIKQLQDVRVVGLFVFAAIVILVTWSGVGAIEQNYSLQKEVSQLQQQDNLQQLQNNNLSLENQYYNTNEYLELEARQLLGKASPGEKLILVPDSVALAETSSLPNRTNLNSSLSAPKPAYQSNFEDWVDFFFHRNQ